MDETKQKQAKENAEFAFEKTATAAKEKSVDSIEECMFTRCKQKLDKFLFTPTDISPLVYFRIVFGMIMLWEVFRFFKGGSAPKLDRYYIQPKFYFRYHGLEWMPGPLPGLYMYHFFAAMAVLYVFLILGLWYRVTTVLTWMGFTYWFLLDETYFLNHFYLVSLLNFLLIFLPAHRNCSLDCYRKPEIRVAKVPSWTLWLIVIQISIPYVYGGFAKLHPDWLRGQPMGMWMKHKMEMYPLSIVGDHLEDDWWVKYFFSWGGLIFDLFIVPLLMYKPTRMFAIANNTFFHLMNAKIFSIGIFPWMMLGVTPLFFEPEWVRPILQFEWILGKPVVTEKEMKQSPGTRKWVLRLFCLWFTWQGLFPFRHHMFKGDVNWTEESYYFSWLMMIRSKKSTAKYTVRFQDTGDIIKVRNKDFLSSYQDDSHAHIPGMIIQFAHLLCKVYGAYDEGPVSVYVDSKSSYNGRAYQRMIYPDRDLCECQVDMFSQADWIVPMSTPFEEKRENLPVWVPRWERRKTKRKNRSSTRKSRAKIEETAKKGKSEQEQSKDKIGMSQSKENVSINNEDATVKRI